MMRWTAASQRDSQTSLKHALGLGAIIFGGFGLMIACLGVAAMRRGGGPPSGVSTVSTLALTPVAIYCGIRWRRAWQYPLAIVLFLLSGILILVGTTAPPSPRRINGPAIMRDAGTTLAVISVALIIWHRVRKADAVRAS
jgi:hypothetical protein